MINLVIFDFDGVLINSEKLALIREINFVQKYRHKKINTNDYVNKFSGLEKHKWIESINEIQDSENFDKIPAEAFEKFIIETDKYVKKNVSVTPGVKSFLKKIDKPIAIASNNSEDYLCSMLKKTGLHKYFQSSIFSADIVGVGKPAPDLFLYVSKKMKCSPLNCVVIEDSISGIIAAKNAGMKVVGFVGNSLVDSETMLRHGADGVISSFTEKINPSIYNLFIDNKN